MFRPYIQPRQYTGTQTSYRKPSLLSQIDRSRDPSPPPLIQLSQHRTVTYHPPPSSQQYLPLQPIDLENFSPTPDSYHEYPSPQVLSPLPGSLSCESTNLLQVQKQLLLQQMFAQQRLFDKMQQETKHKCKNHRNIALKKFSQMLEEEVNQEEEEDVDFETQMRIMEQQLLGKTINVEQEIIKKREAKAENKKEEQQVKVLNTQQSQRACILEEELVQYEEERPNIEMHEESSSDEEFFIKINDKTYGSQQDDDDIEDMEILTDNEEEQFFLPQSLQQIPQLEFIQNKYHYFELELDENLNEEQCEDQLVEVQTINSDSSDKEHSIDDQVQDQSFEEVDNMSLESEAITIEDQSMNDLERLMAVNIDQSPSIPEVEEEVNTSGIIKLDFRSLGLTFEELISTYNLTDSSARLDANKSSVQQKLDPQVSYQANYRQLLETKAKERALNKIYMEEKFKLAEIQFKEPTQIQFLHSSLYSHKQQDKFLKYCLNQMRFQVKNERYFRLSQSKGHILTFKMGEGFKPQFKFGNGDCQHNLKFSKLTAPASKTPPLL